VKWGVALLRNPKRARPVEGGAQRGPDIDAHPASGHTPAMAEAGGECVKKRFVDFLARKNLRLTSQRRAIIDTAFSTRRHFTAEELLTWSRQRDKSVSRATVYRTLPLLTESGLVREMDFGQDQKFYDPNFAEHPRHSHIICEDCHRIIEFDSEELDQLVMKLSRELGFSVTAHRLQISARCEQYRALGACDRRQE
jgi:Fur family transcriptional regulator, ferric uptake regulator